MSPSLRERIACCSSSACGHLLFGGGVLLDQHLADARADLEAVDRLARHEVALHAAARVDRREEEQAGGVLDVADGLPLNAPPPA